MAVKKEKQPGTGTREPVNKRKSNANSRLSFTKQHVEVQHVEKNGTQCFKSGSQRQLDNKFDRDESNVIINTDQKGSCLSPRQKISEMRMKADQSKIETCDLDNLKRMCENPVSCSVTNCAGMTTKELNNQDGEVLIPIKSK